jgi:CSLREA domain-containing protein
MNHHPNRGVLMAALLLGMLGALLSPVTAEASIFVVNTTDDLDDGQCDTNHCSLREAINAANANSGYDEIHFNLPGWDSLSNTIQLDSALPPLADDATIIDGRTEPDYAGIPIVTIYKASGNMEIEAGLILNSNNNEIYGLVLRGFGILLDPNSVYHTDLAGGAIVINGSHNLIEHNTIGHGAMWNAVGVRLSGPGNNVIDNLISGNGGGIIADQPNNVIKGNMIGPDADGDTPVNTGFGIYLDHGSDETLIGGTASGDGNVISANQGTGLEVHSNDCEVFGNLVGLNAAGTSALPNQGVGIVAMGDDLHIGGSSPGQGNVISGNQYQGIWLSVACQYCVIQGNKIGTDLSGTFHIPNGWEGIESEAENLIIGGLSAANGNLIMGNTLSGLFIDDLGRSNFVANNTIAENGRYGIQLGGGVHRNTFTQNSIYDNNDLGIKIPSDNNDDIQYPALDSTNGSTISGTACPNCLIEFFIADPDPSGFGEGKTYLDYVHANGSGTFSKQLGGIGFCKWITATATDGNGNTSEFSENIRVHCFHIGPLLLYPIWTFIIFVFGLIGWRLRRWRPGLPAASAPIFALGGGALFLVLALTLPFVQPEFAPKIDRCGNGVVDAGETCDGDDLHMCLSGQVCENCRCTTVMEWPVCGDGDVDQGEQCDGNDLTMCLEGQVCENCKCITHVEAEPEICIYEALQNSNCRESDYPESRLVETMMEGDSADLIALNPEYTHGLFELDNGEQCWVWLGLMGGEENPFGSCPVEIVDPPQAPRESTCRTDLDERGCIAAGGEWIVGDTTYCDCPEE